MTRSRILLMGLAAVSIVVLAACTVTTSSSGLDLSKAEAALSEETGKTVKLQCPGEIPLQSGLVTTCAATEDGINAVVVITQNDDQGDVGLTIGKTLKVSTLPELFEQETGIAVEVECPADIPIEQGLEVECVYYNDEVEGPLYVTQTDNLGKISWTWG